MSETAKERFFKLLSLVQSGEFAAAEEGLRKALALAPQDPNLLHLEAQTAEGVGDKPRAIAFYRKAIDALPGWVEARYNLARVLNLMPDKESRLESISLLKGLIKTHPVKAVFWEALARFEQAEGLLSDAATHWREALQRAPDNTKGRGQYLLCCRTICDWRENPPTLPDLAPQIAVVLLEDPSLQKKAAQFYCAKQFSAIKPLPRPMPWKHDRVRLGYISSDFHAHATAFLMAELFELHNRDRFDVFVYSYGVDDHSAIRERLKKRAEHFIELNALTPAQCAERIRKDEIDILIDLKGHTSGARLDILAYRPAPLQAHWLGFPGTIGASFIDFFIADPTTVPIGSEKYFTEKVMRMPNCYQVNDRQKNISPAKPKSAYGLPEKSLVLAAFNQTYKITPEIFDIWCSVLEEIPEAILWLYESNPSAAENLCKEAKIRHIDPHRLSFAKPLPLEEHLARYRVVDLALDTYPVGGHTTTSDALWAGTPVVTITGESFASRVAGSILRAAQLPLLVTSSFEEYKKRILDLAHNKAARESIQDLLFEKRELLPLFDTPRFVYDWEDLLISCLKTKEISSS